MTPHDVAPDVTLMRLEELLLAADIVTLHVNLDAATVGFFGRAQFAAMRCGAWFINASRGELVDEEALLEALRQGHIAGAALDVLGDETATGMAEHPLVAYARRHPNLIITPHIGGDRGIDGQNRMRARPAPDSPAHGLRSVAVSLLEEMLCKYGLLEMAHCRGRCSRRYTCILVSLLLSTYG